MQVVFNAQERTLREIVELALSAGWKVVSVARSPGSLFGHIVAVPVPIPMQKRVRAGSGSALLDAGKCGSARTVGLEHGNAGAEEMENMESVGGSRCGTPTFGSRIDLPTFEEAFARFGGERGKVKAGRKENGGRGVRMAGGSIKSVGREVITPERTGLKPALPLKKKVPSLLSIDPPPQQTPTAPSSPVPPLARQLESSTPPQASRQQQRPFASPSYQELPSTPPSPFFARPFQSPVASQRQQPQLQPRQHLTLASPPQIKSPRRTLQSPPPIRDITTHRLKPPLTASTTPPLPSSPVSPVPIQLRTPVLSRKMSSAALVSPSSQLPRSNRLRRSGSMAGLGLGVGGGMGMFALTSGGDPMREGEGERDWGRDKEGECSGGGDSDGMGVGSVLAAAAKIEFGLRLKVAPAP
jgi:hypothetical protein